MSPAADGCARCRLFGVELRGLYDRVSKERDKGRRELARELLRDWTSDETQVSVDIDWLREQAGEA